MSGAASVPARADREPLQLSLARAPGARRRWDASAPLARTADRTAELSAARAPGAWTGRRPRDGGLAGPGPFPEGLLGPGQVGGDARPGRR